MKYVRKDLTPIDADDCLYVHNVRLWQMYKEFKQEHEIKEGTDDVHMHLHRKRMIVLVDRRHLKRYSAEDVATDHVWMYEPPRNCRDIPAEAVPKWHISASKTCLLPNMNYKKGIEAERGNQMEPDDYDKDTMRRSREEEELDQNVTIDFGCMLCDSEFY